MHAKPLREVAQRNYRLQNIQLSLAREGFSLALRRAL
jgi:hypothetical protein